MKKTLTLVVMLFMFSVFAAAQQNFYGFTVKTIDGKDFPLKRLKGKKVMVVNVASKCGLTPQYEQLQRLYDTYQKDGFVIIGFPANNFRSQEPGTNEEIFEFCTKNYGVTFPMMEKISVGGEDIAPLYKWLTGNVENAVSWNFQKFLIDKKGQLVMMIPPKTRPDDPQVISWIEDK